VIGSQEEEPWCAALEYYSTYKVDQLHPVVAKLASLVKAAPSSKLKAVYNKYLSKKFLKVAARAELTGPRISQLTEAS